MSRICFVMMPFSQTPSCTEEEWALIFEDLIKPAVEGANLDYECIRSTATRGNIVGSIMRNLKDSYVVIADLTDRNANVFYELGARHALKDRTILISQNRNDIPFDLLVYANHVYDWKTEDGKAQFTARIAVLLGEIDSNPERPDNPISDFLGRNIESSNFESSMVAPSEVNVAQSLAGSSSEGVDPVMLAQSLAHSNDMRVGNTILRLTRSELLPDIQNLVNELNQQEVPPRIPEKNVLEYSMQYISQFHNITRKVEEFGLASAREGWDYGVSMILKIAGDLISVSESISGGRSHAFSQGVPSLLAWRMLVLCGSVALNEEHFETLKRLLTSPIEVEDNNGRFSNQSLLLRQSLFWPDAMLGNALDGVNYLTQLWQQETHLNQFYPSLKQYHFEIAKFYVLAAIGCPPNEYNHPLYPGFRYIPEARRAISSFHSRLSQSEPYLEGVARSIGLSPGDLAKSWKDRASAVNSINIGWSPPSVGQVKIPESL